MHDGHVVRDLRGLRRAMSVTSVGLGHGPPRENLELWSCGIIVTD